MPCTPAALGAVKATVKVASAARECGATRGPVVALTDAASTTATASASTSIALSRRTVSIGCARAPQQFRAHEAVEVAVEHALSVAHLVVRAVVLDHRVR